AGGHQSSWHPAVPRDAPVRRARSAPIRSRSGKNGRAAARPAATGHGGDEDRPCLVRRTRDGRSDSRSVGAAGAAGATSRRRTSGRSAREEEGRVAVRAAQGEDRAMEELLSSLPQHWHDVIALLLSPVSWLPRMQHVLVDFFMQSPSVWVATAKYVLLLLPALLGVAALWCTQLSIYTLPFRSARVHFASAMLLAWWDAARATWLYWIGLIRCVGVLCGWIVVFAGFLFRLCLEAVRRMATMPFTMTGRVSQRYFQPGVPWVAFVALLLWCVLEASVFAHVLFPMAGDVMTRLAETPEPGRATWPVLFTFLLMLVMGSFACVQALIDAVRTRQFKYIGQMAAIELFVAFFEVMFLYREIVVTFIPQIADQR